MKYVAAIEVGSHELSLSLGLLRPRKPVKVLESMARIVALGSDTYRLGYVSAGIVSEIVEVFRSFSRKIKEYPACQIFALATTAFREASNCAYIVEQIFRETGIRVQVLSNNSETKYNLLSVSHSCPAFAAYAKDSCLVVELGAGSLQLSLFEEDKFLHTQNLRLGSLRLHELLYELYQLEIDISEVLQEYIAGDIAYYQKFVTSVPDIKHLVVCGKSVPYLRKLASHVSAPSSSLSASDFAKLFKLISHEKALSISRREGIPLEYAQMLLPSVYIVAELLQASQSPTIELSNSSLSDGLLLELAAQYSAYALPRKNDTDVLSAARYLALCLMRDNEHCDNVESIALQVFDQSKPLHGLGLRQRLLLQLAAILHNVGKNTSMQDDERRTYDIVRAVELPGLSESERQILACLVYWHNGSFTFGSELTAKLKTEDELCIAKLTAILALANALDAGHKQKIKGVQLKLKADELILSLDSQADLRLELWTTARHKALFEQVFGVKLLLRKKERRS